MASVLYPLGKQALLSAGINLPSDLIKCVLVDSGTYTYNSGHQYFSSISGVQGSPATLANKTVLLGVFDADDALFVGVSGVSIEAVVIYKDTGTSSTSPLIAYIDGPTITPNGGDISVAWDAGANRIFAL